MPNKYSKILLICLFRGYSIKKQKGNFSKVSQQNNENGHFSHYPLKVDLQLRKNRQDVALF